MIGAGKAPAMTSRMYGVYLDGPQHADTKPATTADQDLQLEEVVMMNDCTSERADIAVLDDGMCVSTS